MASYLQTPQAPKNESRTLRSWADEYGVDVSWDQQTSTVTLSSPDTTIKFVSNQGDGFGIGKINADNYHIVNDEQQLYNALNLGKTVTGTGGTSPVSTAYAADYQLSREAEALNRKRNETVRNLNAKKLDIEDEYSRKRGQLYGQYKSGELSQEERLAAKGLNGGYADAVSTRRASAYKTSAENLDVVKNSDVKAVDNAIAQAYTSSADALYSLETNYVSQLLKSARNLEGYNTAMSAAASAAQGIIYR